MERSSNGKMRKFQWDQSGNKNNKKVLVLIFVKLILIKINNLKKKRRDQKSAY